VLQSGTLNQGDSFSQTFAEPGTFDYFCEFHADMKGTVIVQ
jgi:plastocyanin